MIPPLCVVFNPWFSMVCNCEFHRPGGRILTFRVFDHLDTVFHLVWGRFRPYFGPIFNNIPASSPNQAGWHLQHPRIVTEPSWLASSTSPHRHRTKLAGIFNIPASSLHPPCLTIFPAGDYTNTCRRPQNPDYTGPKAHLQPCPTP
jgi:hypothetical protein